MLYPTPITTAYTDHNVIIRGSDLQPQSTRHDRLREMNVILKNYEKDIQDSVEDEDDVIFSEEDIGFLQKVRDIKAKLVKTQMQVDKKYEDLKIIQSEFAALEKQMGDFMDISRETLKCIKYDSHEETICAIEQFEKNNTDIVIQIKKRMDEKKEMQTSVENSIACLQKQMMIGKRLIKIEDVTAAPVTYICSTCIDNDVTHCIKTCGHTFCLKCADKIVKECFICRKFCSKTDKLRIFFS
jgi:hypothetical protein